MAVILNLLPIANGYNLSKINTNFQTIEEAFQEVLGRSGDLPNHMLADLDMNSRDLLNGGAGSFTSLELDGEDIRNIVGSQGPTGPQGPQGPGGLISSIVAGSNIDVDSSNPAAPVISLDTAIIDNYLGVSGNSQLLKSSTHNAIAVGNSSDKVNIYYNDVHIFKNYNGSLNQITMDSGGRIYMGSTTGFADGGFSMGRIDFNPWWDGNTMLQVYATTSDVITILQDNILTVAGHDTLDGMDNGAVRFVARVGIEDYAPSSGPVYLRAMEAHVLVDVLYTNPLNIHKILELGMHTTIAETTDQDFVGIELFNSFGGMHGPWFPSSERAGTGLMIRGDAGWKYGIQYKDTDNTTKLFYVDQYGVGFFKQGILSTSNESTGVGLQVAGRAADQIGVIRMMNNAQTVEYGRIQSSTAAIYLGSSDSSIPLSFAINSVEWLRISTTGTLVHRNNATTIVDAASHLGLRSYTVGTLPSASTAARLIYVSDGTTNKRLAVSDGTNWRFPDGNIVS